MNTQNNLKRIHRKSKTNQKDNDLKLGQCRLFKKIIKILGVGTTRRA